MRFREPGLPGEHGSVLLLETRYPSCFNPWLWRVTVCFPWPAGRNRRPGGKSKIQQTAKEELPPSHTDAGEPDEDCEGRVGGHAGPPPGAEERLAPLAAESGRAQSHHGEAAGGAQVKRGETRLWPFFTLTPGRDDIKHP